MPTAAMLQGTVTGLKRAIDLIKALNDMDKSANVNAVKIELQQIILDAQAERFSLIERVRELETEVADLKAWGAEKDNYKLAKWKHGVMAYVPKESEQASEASHALCATCYDGRKKSVLQAVRLLTAFKITCGGCKNEITTTSQ